MSVIRRPATVARPLCLSGWSSILWNPARRFCLCMPRFSVFSRQLVKRPQSRSTRMLRLVNTRMSSQSIPAVAVEIPRESGKSRPVGRIGALDWTKGALVVCMVAYHAINYSAFRPMGFKALGFLPPSFIPIAGFLVGQVYATKYSLDTWKPYARLLVRGLKLLLVFLVLNVTNCIILKRDIVDGLWEFADRAETIFVSG